MPKLRVDRLLCPVVFCLSSLTDVKINSPIVASRFMFLATDLGTSIGSPDPLPLVGSGS